MKQYKPIRLLTDTYGEDIILVDENQVEEHYRVLMEIEIDKQPYAVLQLHGDPEEEAYVFRVTRSGDDDFIVEDVEDDDEWDAVAEMYCGMFEN